MWTLREKDDYVMSECKTRGICDLVNVETDRKSNVANVKPA